MKYYIITQSFIETDEEKDNINNNDDNIDYDINPGTPDFYHNF